MFFWLLSQKSGQSMTQKGLLISLQRPKTRCGWVVILSGSIGMNSLPDSIRLLVQIPFLVTVGLRTPFPCQLSDRCCPEILKDSVWPMWISIIQSQQEQVKSFPYFKPLNCLFSRISLLPNLFCLLQGKFSAFKGSCDSIGPTR